jgi:hypothetical protein
LTSITAVQPLHVSAWIEQQTRAHAAPTVKLRLAALRHLFDWLVTGQVMPANPAGSVRGPSHVVKSGKTPVLAPEEARAFDRQHRHHHTFRIARPGADRIDGVQLRADRRCARHEGRGRVHAEPPAMGLREKGGKAHAMPCHHSLETYLAAYTINSSGDRMRESSKFKCMRTRIKRRTVLGIDRFAQIKLYICETSISIYVTLQPFAMRKDGVDIEPIIKDRLPARRRCSTPRNGASSSTAFRPRPCAICATAH